MSTVHTRYTDIHTGKHSHTQNKNKYIIFYLYIKICNVSGVKKTSRSQWDQHGPCWLVSEEGTVRGQESLQWQEGSLGRRPKRSYVCTRNTSSSHRTWRALGHWKHRATQNLVQFSTESSNESQAAGASRGNLYRLFRQHTDNKWILGKTPRQSIWQLRISGHVFWKTQIT